MEGEDQRGFVTEAPSPIREYHHTDRDAVVALSLRAWAPVFDSMRRVLGDGIFAEIYGEDWRLRQSAAVGDVLDDDAMRIWVAEEGGEVSGFVAAVMRSQRVGEIEMLAVDPEAANRGLGTRLTGVGTAWLREQGARLAVIGTGGDPGHAPARRVYEKAGYTGLPLARYYRTL
ncbi:MAG TPA: GNAT family N-acetyltransferase [Candidatus Dormibacteraeota bacterium]|jgi:GNAT superfamily N-acetyltransferase|nr:GNAT family N-acetyltransferase [Candidatus Dormibacteraeota bacterium]